MQRAWHKEYDDIQLNDDDEYEYFVANYARLEQELIEKCRKPSQAAN